MRGNGTGRELRICRTPRLLDGAGHSAVRFVERFTPAFDTFYALTGSFVARNVSGKEYEENAQGAQQNEA